MSNTDITIRVHNGFQEVRMSVNEVEDFVQKLHAAKEEAERAEITRKQNLWACTRIDIMHNLRSSNKINAIKRLRNYTAETQSETMGLKLSKDIIELIDDVRTGNI